jgi:hypothetical protein
LSTREVEIVDEEGAEQIFGTNAFFQYHSSTKMNSAKKEE